jgi:diguanylate cyclase (GGDEF)-like protein/PAS domain S-box-containing protein
MATLGPQQSIASERTRLFEFSSDMLATIDPDGCFLDLNGAWTTTLGFARDELIGHRFSEFLHPDDLSRTLALIEEGTTAAGEVTAFENRYLCKHGGYRWLEWNARRVDGVWYAVTRDVTERRILEERATRDPLTGLPNRAALTERLQAAVARLERHPGLVAVLFVDLDRFKAINDGRGHEIGDRLLCASAANLLETVRGADSVARFGGDEFVVLVQDVSRHAEVVAIADRVVAGLEQPIGLDGEQIRIGASVGIALTTDATCTPETLLREADVAMYRAKARGGGCHEVFDDSVRAEVSRRLNTERELRVAVQECDLVVHYQPIVTLPETSVSHCEALVRWQHRRHGLVAPGDFLPVAEESDLIVRIGELVLDAACEQARKWRRAGADVSITVNVSTRQLDDPSFTELVQSVLRRSRLPAPALCLEITETAIMQHVDRIAPRLDAMRRLGVRIAMDDFGTGYSSLRYLRLLPLDIIKIDKSFVRGIGSDRQDRAVVTGILAIARETGRAVIAEGVETEPLHAELIGLGCELAQGFLYERPRPPSELRLDGYSSRVGQGIGDPLVIREFMRQIGIPARMRL